MDVDKMGWDGDKKKKLTISYIMVDLGSYLSHRFFLSLLSLQEKGQEFKAKKESMVTTNFQLLYYKM